METLEKKEHSTRDLVEAASLIALKFPLINIDFQAEGSKLVGYFIFEDSQALKEARLQSISKELAFEPRSFQGIIRSLKAQLSNTKRSPSSSFNKEG